MQKFTIALFWHRQNSVGQSKGVTRKGLRKEKRAKEVDMSAVLWMNIPLMVLFLGLWIGVPLWFVVRRHEWHGKPEARIVPAYLAERRAPRTRGGLIRVPRTAHYDGRFTMRPVSGGANG